MKPILQYTVLACALAQAFPVYAAGPDGAADGDAPVARVVVSAARPLTTERAGVAGFGDSALIDTPASVTAIGRAQLDELGIRNTTGAMQLDASVSDAYNAVGYAEQFSIRGFKLDNNSSYRKDGMIVPADTQIPLENKERIEILKGLSGLTAGISSPGGIVNYVTKRPTDTPLRTATFEVRERGTVYGALDLGGRFEDRRFGYRINAAAEDLHSYVRGADGQRQFASGAFDFQISPDALLQLDADYQHKSQLTAPGYQLIRNEVLPANVSPSMLLNDQPWARPVDTVSSNLGLRFAYRLTPDWNATVAVNKHWFRRDDYTAFPYGCSNEGEGFYPGFCSNGDYDVYDYQSTGERKSPLAASAQIQGRFSTGALRHQATFGLSYTSRRDSLGDYVYDYAGSSNIYHHQIVPPAPGNPRTGPVTVRHQDRERGAYAQDIVSLSERLVLHAGLRYESVASENAGLAGTTDTFLLPNLALVYRATDSVNLYASAAHGMEYGGAGGIDTLNYGAPLAPKRSRQLELGAKASVNDALQLSAALFQIRRGHEYTRTNADDTTVFVREGLETNRGLELSAQGKLAAGLDYGLSLTALNTLVNGTTTPSINGKRVTDVPALKTSTWLMWDVPALPGLKADARWQYAGKKAFDEANAVFVPGYHVVGLGASYGLRVGSTKATLRASVDNVLNKFYWRDVTPDLGGYLIPGAPRTFALSLQVAL